MSEPRVTPTQYTVTFWPDDRVDSMNAHLFDIRIEANGKGQWAVRDTFYAYGRQGQRTHEPSPSSRTERFLKAYRFDFDEALRIATKAARNVVINGRTMDDVLAWEDSQ